MPPKFTYIWKFAILSILLEVIHQWGLSGHPPFVITMRRSPSSTPLVKLTESSPTFQTHQTPNSPTSSNSHPCFFFLLQCCTCSSTHLSTLISHFNGNPLHFSTFFNTGLQQNPIFFHFSLPPPPPTFCVLQTLETQKTPLLSAR